MIGRGFDLSAPGALNPGEYTLRGWTNVQPMQANQLINIEHIQDVMDLGLPIRDASDILDVDGPYLNDERQNLIDQGWQFRNGSWVPPGSG